MPSAWFSSAGLLWLRLGLISSFIVLLCMVGRSLLPLSPPVARSSQVHLNHPASGQEGLLALLLKGTRRALFVWLLCNFQPDSSSWPCPFNSERAGCCEPELPLPCLAPALSLLLQLCRSSRHHGTGVHPVPEPLD